MSTNATTDSCGRQLDSVHLVRKGGVMTNGEDLVQQGLAITVTTAISLLTCCASKYFCVLKFYVCFFQRDIDVFIRHVSS